MAMHLLERDHELATLQALLGETATGQGRIALISGEAGIGKTTLVERFLAQAREGSQPARILWAACEALFTPRPLGPFYDIARQTTSPLRALLDSNAHRAALFAAVLDDLTSAPTVLVIEDIHWADEATLDLIKYLSRRIQQTSTLLILTWRDDEVDKDHPLRLVLGELPTPTCVRLPLLPLSEHAVATLAQQVHRPPGRLHAITGGNPFFVIEALTYDAPGAPTSVSDAVLARIARRSPAAQRLLELVAVVPNRTERWIVEALNVGDAAALDECLAAQMLRLNGQSIAFRHELARQAVEGALSPVRRQALHAEILRTLLERGETPGAEQTPLARLVHHATQAEDAPLVLRFAPEAAAQAATQGAHREAVAHYQTALRYDDQMTSEQQAQLLDELSNQQYLTGRVEEAIATSEMALALWRALDHIEKVGRTLRRLSRLNWLFGRNVEAERHGLAAVEALETLPPSHELAMAYGNLAQLGTRTSDSSTTLFWGERAITLAGRLGDFETLSYTLNSMGAAEIESGDKRGSTKLEQSLAIALEHGFEEHAARAYANLVIHRVLLREYAQVERFLQDGIAYCAERDLDPWGHFLRWAQARARLDQGDWMAAEEDAIAILNVPWMAVTNRIPALLVLGRVRARRGDPSAEALLDEARDLAFSVGEEQRIEQVAAARAEWRWLQGDLVACATEVGMAFRRPYSIVRPWYQSELVFWLWRGGGLTTAPESTFPPYALQITGDWRAAASAWERLGCPWEQALALLDGDEAAKRAALAIFERLDATPAAEIARRKLRQAGARGLSRGPYRVARANPQGLTNRQLEVLPLLAEGRSNAEIAGRLSTSPRTVEHHVSAVLAKLNAHSRAEAVRRAYELGLLAPTAK
ncbi:MAG TPA: AAA family ATPase [Ktedonobacterales bacterium]|jgi:DNA-binding CsgD family transcriptional regulator